MGYLADGKWHDQWYDTKKEGGRFKRTESQFRHWVTTDGSAGPSGDAGFKAESGRYHLYVSHACPWANRTMILRALKGLEDHISVSVVHPLMLDKGWTFEKGDGVISDPINQAEYMYQVYLAADEDYYGRVTVPVLWDKKSNTIVSNESAEIIRMLNSAFNDIAANPKLDLYPSDLRSDIDEINAMVYDNVNNGVYKAGFATTQEAYEEALYPLFETLEKLESILANKRYLLGDTLTEADIRLFTTIIRFDPVYVGHFKCNLKRIKDFPNLSGWMREIYQMPGIADTIHMDHIKTHYYSSHTMINPTAIVPAGPELDLTSPHGRDHLKLAA